MRRCMYLSYQYKINSIYSRDIHSCHLSRQLKCYNITTLNSTLEYPKNIGSYNILYAAHFIHVYCVHMSLNQVDGVYAKQSTASTLDYTRLSPQSFLAKVYQIHERIDLVVLYSTKPTLVLHLSS